MKSVGTFLIVVAGVAGVVGAFLGFLQFVQALADQPPSGPNPLRYFVVAAYFFLCGIILFGFGSIAPQPARPTNHVRPAIGPAAGRLITRHAAERNAQEADDFIDSLR